MISVRASGRPTCEKNVSYGNGFHFRKCGRPAVNGAFCGLHDPKRPDKERRREKAKVRFAAETARWQAPGELADLRAAVREFLSLSDQGVAGLNAIEALRRALAGKS